MVRRPSLKLAVLGLVVLGLAGVLTFAAVREATTTSRTAAPAARPSLTAPRRALTASEEVYARALWSIHSDVKGTSFRMTMGGINYTIRDIDRAELRRRTQAALEIYRGAEVRVEALDPPASLRSAHREYLDALRLYQRSAAEMLETSEDGRDEHLVAALPLSQEASRKLLTVGNVIWPGEYVPN
jgi:hypothetical protein